MNKTKKRMGLDLLTRGVIHPVPPPLAALVYSLRSVPNLSHFFPVNPKHKISDPIFFENFSLKAPNE